MKCREIKAALEECGFRITQSHITCIKGRHEDTGAELRANKRAGEWRFTILYKQTSYVMTPANIGGLVHLLTVSFSADARSQHQVTS